MDYYNENDPYAAQWLKNLSTAGLIPKGKVDERDIRKIRATELVGFRQAHFFAGIGGWAEALRLAGWPEDLPVWTGSCPCQPFSSAGSRKGFQDKRHLWPAWKPLIKERRPSIIFGEQVSSKVGRVWLARVRADLEALGYSFGASDLCAAGIGAPHIRQRFYWVAHTTSWRREWRKTTAEQSGRGFVENRSDKIGAWDNSVPRRGLDGKTRRIESGASAVANGFPGRVGQIRAWGNAIVPALAAEFIGASMDVLGIQPLKVRS